MERNDISRLPGGIFTRAFVRSYAAEVGLNPEETLREFLEQFPVEGLVEGSPYSKGDALENDLLESQQQTAGTLLRLVLVSVLVIAVVIYFSFRGGDDSPGGSGPAVDAPLPEAQPGVDAAPQAGSDSRDQAASGPPQVADERRPAQDSPSADGQLAPLEAGAQARTDRGDPQGLNGSLTIDIHPSAPCWVSLTLDGQTVFARLMQAGEREIRQARREIIVSVGDAGAFDFDLNRRQGRSLGDDGQVVTARISHDNYLTFVTP